MHTKVIYIHVGIISISRLGIITQCIVLHVVLVVVVVEEVVVV